jgi:predicted nucleic acid-binding Zn ribbon protein
MSLKPVNDILKVLAREGNWHNQPMMLILQCWSEVVGVKVAAQTRPVSIQRDVLWVATSSSVWAQNLTFGRKNLLLKLNQKLSQPLGDIRFSTAQWEGSGSEKQPQPTFSPQEHPSYLGDAPAVGDVNQTFADWADVMRSRSHHLPLCPNCQCPTPPGELEHWLVCAPCAAKRLSGDRGN